MILRWHSLRGQEEEKGEELSTVGNSEFYDSGYAAYTFGFYYQNEYEEYVPNQFWFFNSGRWDNKSVIFSLQPYFEHIIDETKYSYEIGFFDDPWYEEIPDKEHPIEGNRPSNNPDDFVGIITWKDKKTYKFIGDEIVVVPGLDASFVASETHLSSPERPYVLRDYHLEDFDDHSVEYYLWEFANICRTYGHGVEIKHKTDTDKYYYVLTLTTVEELRNN